MKENMIKRNPLIPLMNEGLGELKCRRHFVPFSAIYYFCFLYSAFCIVQYAHDKCHIKYYLCNNCTQSIGFIHENCYDWVRKGEVRWKKEIKR